MRNWKETLAYYATHQNTHDFGFNPDGMCLKVCRYARDIAAKFLTAKQSQDATPKEFRVYKVEDLRAGMVLYFDDPNDSNAAGHIVTQIGRVKGANLSDLNDIIVETNSVKAGEVVRVRASYFKTHWGDSFQFGAFWLNGVELDYPMPKPPEPEKEVGEVRLQNFRESRPDWDVKILDRVEAQGRRDIGREIDRIEEAVKALPTDQKDTRVKEFVELFDKRRILRMKLLNDAIRDGRMGRVETQRDKLRTIIKRINNK